jgi:DNA repair exonuclease SbcCD nuclease subunit
MKNKALVIGDCHFYNAYPSLNYLEEQFSVIRNIIDGNDPKIVVFLGDVFHFRKPDPETITRVLNFFSEIQHEVYIVRGNHDTASKSDESLVTILDILDRRVSNTNVTVIKDTEVIHVEKACLAFIPHYESEDKIVSELNRVQGVMEKFKDTNKIIFGHFGYKGCLNTNGDEDFGLKVDMFRHPTFLGHIHKPVDEGKVHIVGTPYSTSFSEADNPHRYALIDLASGEHEYREINFGLRYLVCDYGSLDSNKEFINDKKYTTILRVYLNQITDQNSVDLRRKIMEEYEVAYVDMKYLPLVSDESHLSTFRPSGMTFDLTDDFINSYVEECNSSIPKDMLLQGLKMLKDS